MTKPESVNPDLDPYDYNPEGAEAVSFDFTPELFEPSEPLRSRRELSWRALVVITVIGLAILASILGSLLQHQPRIERTSFSESSTGYCVKEYWKLSSVDIKASEAQGMDAVNYYKAKNPNASPAYKTACN